MEDRGGFKMAAHGRVHREGRARFVSGERQRFDRWRALVRTRSGRTVSCLREGFYGVNPCEKVLSLIFSLDELVGGA